jgi:hypothetical protein
MLKHLGSHTTAGMLWHLSALKALSTITIGYRVSIARFVEWNSFTGLCCVKDSSFSVFKPVFDQSYLIFVYAILPLLTSTTMVGGLWNH